MRSDFSGARKFLERANECLKGSDITSEQMRTAIDLLIEVSNREECSRHDDDDEANVLPFRRGER